MNKLILAAVALVATAPSAFAVTSGACIANPALPICAAVPEISAVSGLAAVAALAAGVAIVRERMSR